MSHRKIITTLFSLLLVAGLSAAPAQARFTGVAPTPVTPEALDAFIRSEMETNDIPGMTVALIQDGQLTWMQGYGTASNGQPLTPQSSLYIGSVSKSFTALIVMRLAEQGRLNLDAPVQQYLPDFHLAEPAGARITLRQFLNQTSGLCGLNDPDPNQTAPNLQEQVRRLAPMRLSSEPGTKFCYNNHNFTVLGAVIEAVTGQSYAQALDEQILTPLEMRDSGLNPDALPHMAAPYGQFFGLAFPREQQRFPGAAPAGYIISSVEDLTHYVNLFLDGGEYNGQRLLSPEALQELWAPRADIGSPYAMGWFKIESEGQTMIFHGGDIESYASGIAMFPQSKTAVIFLANQNSLYRAFVGYPDFKQRLYSFVAGQEMLTLDDLDRLSVGLTSAFLVQLFVVMRVLFAVDLVVIALRFVFLRRAAAWARRRHAFWRALWAGIDLLFPAVGLLLIFASRPLLGLYLVDLIQFMPDLTLWLFLASGLGLARGLAKLALLTRKAPAAA